MDGYSPYAAKKNYQKRGFRLPSLPLPSFGAGTKKWMKILLVIVIGMGVLMYILLGELRFFANHYLRLSFFSKNYVILLQNNYELRPGGGFITAYGQLDTLFGFPRNLSFHNAYEVDTKAYVKPPYPHEELLKNEWYQGYTFRDANWQPDFPNSVKDLTDFYRQKFPDRDVDGFIVINFSLIEKLADAFGGIAVNGEKLTGKNLFQALELAVNNVDRHDEAALNERKNVLGELASGALKKIKWNPRKTRDVLVRGLQTKDLYLWLKSEGLQKRLVKKGWANSLIMPKDSDFLAINLANLGAKKADRYLMREMHQYVNLTGEIPEISVEMTLRYPGFKNAHSDDYKGYLRVYVPADAALKETPLDSAVEREGEWNVIGSKIILPAGGKTTLGYSYTLPRTLLPAGEYRLRIAKQSGNETRYAVTAEGPAEAELKSDTFNVKENRATYQGVPEGDLDLNLSLSPDVTPPYPIEQVFEDLNTVKIFWSEPIDPATGNDALNYTIWDSNQTEKLTDSAKVIYAEIVEAGVSRLELEGVERQALERYKIELKNLRDLAGNSIVPNPKTITVVQRFTEKPADALKPAATEPAPVAETTDAAKKTE